MDLTKYILPYPYQAYDHSRRDHRSFDNYKEKIIKWVDVHTYGDIRFEVKVNYDDCISKTKTNTEMYEWMLSHTDKIRNMGGLSGVMFGIIFDKCTGNIRIHFPSDVDIEDIPLYPGYDEKEFRELDHIQKLEWMYSNCEFIPFTAIYMPSRFGFV